MHQLALSLFRQGNKVTGSDDEINDPAKSNLQKAGILPEKNGWHPYESVVSWYVWQSLDNDAPNGV